MCRPIFLVIFSIIVGSPWTWAQSANELYTQAIKDYQEQKFVDAFDNFQKADALEPLNPFTLYNWGLAAYKVEKKGLALGLWRRAVFADPEFAAAKSALAFAAENMPDESFASGTNWTTLLKRGLFREISLPKLLLVNALLLAFGGWLGLRYLGQRRRAIEDELPMPSLSPIPIFFGLLFIISTLAAVLKISAETDVRATVTGQNVQLMTAPLKESNSIFSLIEGVEVDVEEVQNDWTMVSYPDGMTGWVLTSEIFINSGLKK